MLEIAAVGGALAGYGLARLAFNLLGLRYLGAESVGRVNLAMSLALLLALPASTGVAAMLSRFLPIAARADPARAAVLLGHAAKMSVVWLIVPLPLVLIAQRLDPSWPGGMGFTLLVVGWAALYAGYNLNRSHLFALRDVGSAFGVEVASLGLFGCACLVVFAVGRWPWLPLTAYYLPGVFVLAARRPWRRVGTTSGFSPGELHRFATWAFLGSAASLGVAYATTVLVSATEGLARAGMWATLLTAVTPLLLAPRALNAFFMPRLAVLSESGSVAMRRGVLLHQRVSSLLAMGAALLVALAGPGLSGLILGSAPVPEFELTWLLVVAAAVLSVRAEPLFTGTAAAGQAGACARASLAALAICGLVWAAAVPAHGIVGVAWGYAAFVAGAPICLSWLRRWTKTPAIPFRFFIADAVTLAAGLALIRSSGWAAPLLVALAGFAVAWRESRQLRAEWNSLGAPVVSPGMSPDAPGPPRAGGLRAAACDGSSRRSA